MLHLLNLQMYAYEVYYIHNLSSHVRTVGNFYTRNLQFTTKNFKKFNLYFHHEHVEINTKVKI